MLSKQEITVQEHKLTAEELRQLDLMWSIVMRARNGRNSADLAERNALQAYREALGKIMRSVQRRESSGLHDATCASRDLLLPGQHCDCGARFVTVDQGREVYGR